jgi:hypothetical protein
LFGFVTGGFPCEYDPVFSLIPALYEKSMYDNQNHAYLIPAHRYPAFFIDDRT